MDAGTKLDFWTFAKDLIEKRQKTKGLNLFHIFYFKTIK